MSNKVKILPFNPILDKLFNSKTLINDEIILSFNPEDKEITKIMSNKTPVILVNYDRDFSNLREYYLKKPIGVLNNREILLDSTVPGDINFFLDDEYTVSKEVKHQLLKDYLVKFSNFIVKKERGLYFDFKNTFSFSKYSGCGNDFIMVDNRYHTFSGDIVKLCQRGNCIGADGLILVTNCPNYDFKWDYYNKDGSLVEMCGNGARCVAHFARKLGIPVGKEINFINSFGIKTRAVVNKDSVKINIYTDIIRRQLPFDQYRTLTRYLETKSIIDKDNDDVNNLIHYITVGVPHLIIQAKNVNDIDISEVGEYINNKILDNPLNINIVDAFHRIRTYERGVNEETLACGTGCCASMISLDKTSLNLKVKSGDTISCSRITDGVSIEGPAKEIYCVK